MSSEITYAPIIPIKTTEEIIEEYNQQIRVIENENKGYIISREKLKNKICDLKKNIQMIGRNHKSEKIDFTTISKSTISELNTNLSIDMSGVTEDEQGDRWIYEENLDETKERYVNFLKDSICETEQDAIEVRELIEGLEKASDVDDELINKVNTVINKKQTLTNEAVNVIREYTMIQMMSGNDSVFSYEEAIRRIDIARSNVKKIIVKDYQKNIIREACNHVGIQLVGVEYGDQSSFSIDGIDDCEIEMTFFEEGGIMLETVGIIEAANQQSLDKKRSTVENAKKVCSKMEEIGEYIKNTYPDVKMEIKSIKNPSENNINMVVRENKTEKKKNKKKRYMNLDD